MRSLFNTTRNYLFLIAAIPVQLLLWSCKKNDAGSTTTDVYAAGSTSEGGFPTATYWKNGTAINLTDGIKEDYGTNQSFINTMFISGRW